MDISNSKAQGERRIALMEKSDSKRWDEFVLAASDGTFFHLSGWQRIIEEVLGHETKYLFCEERGCVVGVLPLAQVKSLLFGNALMSLPFLAYGGPITRDEGVRVDLIARAARIAEDLGVDYVELRNRSRPVCHWDVNDIYVTFRKRLSADPDENLRLVPRKQRAMIRKGMNAGLDWKLDDGVDRLYESLLECKRNLGTPFFSKSYLQALRETFGERAEVVTITRGKSTVCSVMSFRFRNEILPYYGGGGLSARTYKGNDFMYWAVMEKAARDGVEIFDYGRSRVGAGSYHFKKHWGFEPEPLFYERLPVRRNILPDLNPDNPRFDILIKAWQKLPTSVAGILGPPLARRLG